MMLLEKGGKGEMNIQESYEATCCCFIDVDEFISPLSPSAKTHYLSLGYREISKAAFVSLSSHLHLTGRPGNRHRGDDADRGGNLNTMAACRARNRSRTAGSKVPRLIDA